MSLIEQAAKRLEELRRAGLAPARSPGDEFRANGTLAANRPAFRAAAIADPGFPVEELAKPAKTPPGRPDVLVLDYIKLAQLGFVTPDTPRSGVAEEFRVLKRPLLANVSRQAKQVRNANLIMVASAVPGEGKTFTAVNLAMSMAMELDQTVLLVDADVARPSLPSLLGMSSRRGLMDVMLDKTVDLAQVLVKTNIDKLTILPSGSPHRQSTELLASESMTRLLNEMAVRYPDRIIIFDTPPLLFTTEAQALAAHMGQIVFVVQAEATLQRDVKRALAAIESCPVKMIVLNQARTVAQGAYGYGYAH